MVLTKYFYKFIIGGTINVRGSTQKSLCSFLPSSTDIMWFISNSYAQVYVFTCNMFTLVKVYSGFKTIYATVIRIMYRITILQRGNMYI